MPTHVGRAKVGNYDATQPTLKLPPAFASQFPADYEAEIDIEPGRTGNLLLVVVSPTKKSAIKRYKIVRNSGSYRISVPRWWLRDAQAKAEDSVTVTASPTQHNAAIISLVRK